MNHVFLDFESTVSKRVTLKRLTLRQYLAEAKLLCVSVAWNDDEPVYIHDPASNPSFLAALRGLAERDDVCFVAHNASFDIRCMTLGLGLPYPKFWRCSLEAAMCAWPNHPGGYGLDALSRTLNTGIEKLGKGDKVMGMSAEELEAYVNNDTRLCRAIYRMAQARIPECEWRIADACSRVKELHFEVDPDAVRTAIDQFTTQADTYGSALVAALEDEDADAVGVDEDGSVRSVKPHQVKRLLLEHLGFSTHSISQKKVNPVTLAASPDAAKAVDAASKTNRSLSHKRRVNRFRDVKLVDAELNWYAAHTGRFASRASGKGLNLLNMPKHDKEVAKLVRQMFRLPTGYVFVRGDEANVEYRVNGLLCSSIHVHNLFAANVFADPYSAFGQACTGQVITKADPSRQFFKAAVLGLGYLMGVERWAREILNALAKPKPDFSLADLRAICETNRWPFPHGQRFTGMLAKLGCDPVVITVAAHSHRLFHEIHPEFRRTSNWILALATEVSRGCRQSTVDEFYTRPDAPDRTWLDARLEDRFEGYSLGVRLGGWEYPTVYWRDIGIRDVPGYGPSLSFMNGKRGYRGLSPQIALENLAQSCARNRTCKAYLDSEQELPYLLNVHDELLPVVPAEVGAVLAARDTLIRVCGPATVHADGFPAWAVMIDPREINVSRSFYEVDVGKLDSRLPSSAAWWDALPNHPELLESLP